MSEGRPCHVAHRFADRSPRHSRPVKCLLGGAGVSGRRRMVPKVHAYPRRATEPSGADRMSGIWVEGASRAWRRARPLLPFFSLYITFGTTLGFLASGAPLILRARGVELAEIGLLQLINLPVGLTFLWAVAIDRLRLPGLPHRIGWIALMQGRDHRIAAGAEPGRGLAARPAPRPRSGDLLLRRHHGHRPRSFGGRDGARRPAALRGVGQTLRCVAGRNRRRGATGRVLRHGRLAGRRAGHRRPQPSLPAADAALPGSPAPPRCR